MFNHGTNPSTITETIFKHFGTTPCSWKRFSSATKNAVPSGKLTWQWKMDLLKMYSLFENGIFHCHVSLPEGSRIFGPSRNTSSVWSDHDLGFSDSTRRISDAFFSDRNFAIGNNGEFHKKIGWPCICHYLSGHFLLTGFLQKQILAHNLQKRIWNHKFAHRFER